MRRSIIPITLSLAMLAGSGAIASDQIYKCIDPNGATVLSDKACAAIESVPANEVAPTTAPVAAPTDMPATVATLPAMETERPAVTKEYYKLPQAELERSNRAKAQLATAAPKIDIATLKAAKLSLELSDKTASLR